MTQLLLDFSETLKDADGDTVVVDRLPDTEKIISRLLKCSRKEALRAFEQLNGARVIEKNMRTGTEKIIKERL